MTRTPSGVVFDPFDASFRTDPYPVYARLRDEDPVHRTDDGGWVLSRYDDCARALADDALGVEPPSDVREERRALVPPSLAVLGETMLFRDPPDHTRLRRIVSAAFTPRAVDTLRARVVSLVEELLDGVASRAETDLIADLAHPLPVRVICELLDIPEADHERIRVWSGDLGGVVDIARDEQTVRAGALAADALLDYFRTLVERRARRPGSDLLSALVTARDRLSDDELLAVCVQLLFGGHETTQNLIGNGVLALLRHPAELDRLRTEPALAKTAVEELLRYDSPGQLAGRWTRAPVRFGDRTLGAGEHVLVLLGSANRDPRTFTDPDAPDVGRSPNRHLAFGGGVHFCLGAPLARLEAAIAIPALLARFPRIEPAGEPVWRPTLALRGLSSLPLRVHS